MSVPPQKTREIIFQLLFSEDLAKPSAEGMQSMLMQQLSISRSRVRECQRIALEIKQHLPEIDGLISQSSTSYNFSRIQKIELNILRLGVFELVIEKKVPPKVVIAEAIRISKKFGTKESARFVNAVLDRIYKESNGLSLQEDEEINVSFQDLMESEQISSEIPLEITKDPEEDDENDEYTDSEKHSS